MNVWHSSSSESRKCAKCGRMTSTYKVYEQTNIQIKLPLCDTEERDCYRKIDLKDLADISIKLLNREIQKIII